MSSTYNHDFGTRRVQRRDFIGKALIGAGVVSAGAIIGTAGTVLVDSGDGGGGGGGAAAAGGGSNMPGMDHNGAPIVVTGAPANTAPTPAEMDEMHRKGIQDFLKNQQTPLTKGKGNQPLAGTIENGVRVFRLTVDELQWEVSPGKTLAARGYNNMVPGPVLRATEGETVRMIITNNLKESTSVHWHGLYVPNNMDGVPFINQEPIQPGESFTYEFTLRNPGTHMYHSHENSLDQVNRGLLGAFIVDPKDKASYPAHDREYIMVLNDLNLGFTINGKGFPATEALVAKRGERVLIRYLNEGVMNHPMHLHGMPMQVFAKDGWPVNPPQMCDTLDVAPGNRYDVIVEATEAGVWAFHCHILSHAEGPEGMFGLVTALIVQ